MPKTANKMTIIAHWTNPSGMGKKQAINLQLFTTKKYVSLF